MNRVLLCKVLQEQWVSAIENGRKIRRKDKNRTKNTNHQHEHRKTTGWWKRFSKNCCKMNWFVQNGIRLHKLKLVLRIYEHYHLYYLPLAYHQFHFALSTSNNRPTEISHSHQLVNSKLSIHYLFSHIMQRLILEKLFPNHPVSLFNVSFSCL